MLARVRALLRDRRRGTRHPPVKGLAGARGARGGRGSSAAASTERDRGTWSCDHARGRAERRGRPLRRGIPGDLRPRAMECASSWRATSESSTTGSSANERTDSATQRAWRGVKSSFGSSRTSLSSRSSGALTSASMLERSRAPARVRFFLHLSTRWYPARGVARPRWRGRPSPRTGDGSSTAAFSALPPGLSSAHARHGSAVASTEARSRAIRAHGACAASASRHTAPQAWSHGGRAFNVRRFVLPWASDEPLPRQTVAAPRLWRGAPGRRGSPGHALVRARGRRSGRQRVRGAEAGRDDRRSGALRALGSGGQPGDAWRLLGCE